MSNSNLTDKIESWDKKELVRFCLFCCYKVKHTMDGESFEVVKLVERWLEDESSVSKEELRKAAYCAAYTAYYAANAANTANAAAAYVAYNTANAAAYLAIEAAYYAAYAAAYAAKTLRSSEEALYLEYMRGKLSNIMEG